MPAVVEAHHDVSVSGRASDATGGWHPPSDRARSGRPARRRRGPARVLRTRIKIGRKDAPAVKGDAVADVDAEEFRSSLSRVASILSLSALFSESIANVLVRRQAIRVVVGIVSKAENRWIAQLGIRRDLVVVRARLLRGRDSLAGPCRRDDAIKIALGWIVGRGDEVDPLRLVVDGEQLDHVEIAGGDQRRFLPSRLTL